MAINNTEQEQVEQVEQVGKPEPEWYGVKEKTIVDRMLNAHCPHARGHATICPLYLEPQDDGSFHAFYRANYRNTALGKDLNFGGKTRLGREMEYWRPRKPNEAHYTVTSSYFVRVKWSQCPPDAEQPEGAKQEKRDPCWEADLVYAQSDDERRTVIKRPELDGLVLPPRHSELTTAVGDPA
jgi:hypothetical protein